jgi:nucleotide-binding universal stress UspA family protein
MASIRRILYASDFSKASRRAFATALTMARSEHATLTVVHVVVPFVPPVPEQYLDAATWDQIDAQARRWGRQQLTRLTERARKAGVRVVMLLVEGDPAEQIVRAARSKRADLVVVGTHGRRGFSKFFLGSVAERVVATAPCPVVTVRDR